MVRVRQFGGRFTVQAAIAMVLAGIGTALTSPALAQIIIAPPPVIIVPPDVVIVPPEKRPVLVEFEALGKDWGSVWVNGQELVTFRNFNRRQAIALKPGAYRIVVTGTTRMDVWDAGYLDVSKDTNIIRIRVAKGYRLMPVSQPQVWLPDSNLDWMRVWH
ncbi:MAG: hypothetical protein NZ772_02405 [Cyanobacteria bacterium]|nr:hypothetical protein [Cyanobacteriota bacterium]MDW8199690.1 hypothetical protein [Cyanobacteriota bacterium SKYGB_h_bin112]